MVVDALRLRHVQVPNISPAHLVTQGQHLPILVQRESDKPDLTVFEPDFVDNRHLVLGKLEVLCIGINVLCLCLILVHEAWFPANDCVFTRLGKNKVTKPFAAIDIVPVNVPCAEVREVAELSWEDLLGFQSYMSVGELDGRLKIK